MIFPSLFRRPQAPAPAPSTAPAPEVQRLQESELLVRQLQIGERILKYSLQRSQRASIGFLVNEQGLRVSAPQRASIATIEAALISKQRWIFSKLDQRAAHEAAKPSQDFAWQDGAQLPYLGKTITLRVLIGKAMPAFLDSVANCLVLNFARETSSEKIKQRAQTWLQAQAEHEFTQRLQTFASKMGVTYANLTLSQARTQWGSCTAQGNIRLNWRLIHFHPGLIDYVVVHELAHRVEMNHSPRFWALVEAQYPYYKQAREQLKIASRALPNGLMN